MTTFMRHESGETIQLIPAMTEWTAQTAVIAYRVWNGRLYRREINEAYFGGHQIKSIALGWRIAAEWLNLGEPVAAKDVESWTGVAFAEA